MQTHNKCNAGLLALILMMVGCAEWNSYPVVVQQNFGNAVNNMVKNQTLCAERGSTAQYPKLCPEYESPVPVGMDGQKAHGVINAYRDVPNSIKEGNLEDAKQGVSFDVKNVGSGSGAN